MKRLFITLMLITSLTTPLHATTEQEAPSNKRCKEHTSARATHLVVGTIKGIWGLGWLAAGAVSAAGAGATGYYCYDEATKHEGNAAIFLAAGSASLSLATTSACALTLGCWLTSGAYRNLRNAWNYPTYLKKKHAVCTLKQCQLR